MPSLVIKVGGDKSGFDQTMNGVIARTRSTQKNLRDDSERWLKRERELNGLTAAERRQQVMMRGQLEQTQRNREAAAIRRQRNIERAAEREREEAEQRLHRQRIRNIINTPTPSRFGAVGGLLASGAAAIATGIAALIRAGVRAEGVIQDLSDKTGIASETLHRWGAAARQAGTDASALADGAARMSVKIKEALENPESDAAKAFEAFGVSIEDLKTQSIEQVFERIAESIRQGKTDAIQIANALKIFGRGGAGLIPAFKQGITEESAKTAPVKDKTTKAFDELGDQWERFTTNLGAHARKSLEPVARFLRGVVSVVSMEGLPKDQTRLTPEEQQAIASTSNIETDQERATKDEAEREAKRIAAEEEQRQQEIKERATQINERIAEMRRNAALDEMSTDERINALIEERAQLMEEINDFEGFNEAEIAEKALKVEEINAEIRNTEKESTQPKSDPFSFKPDSLAQVGGFVGGGIPSAQNAVLGAMNQTANNTRLAAQALQRIERKMGTEQSGPSAFE